MVIYKTKLFVMAVEEKNAVVLVTSAILQRDDQEGEEMVVPLTFFPRVPEVGDLFRGYLNDLYYWEGIYEY